MKVEKVVANNKIETFIELEQKKYEIENKIACNYTPFCFVAKHGDIIIGAIAGATFFKEIYIDELVVKKVYRNKGIGSILLNSVENYYKNSGFNNINTCTNRFQAPGFYAKCGFKLEFVRKNKNDSRLDKYFYIKYIG